MASVPQSEVDVLIVGAGPAGLMLALWLSRLGVVARIIDKRTAKVFSGQADGFQARTLEILDSFGIGEQVWKEANQMFEVSFWNPNPGGRIQRNSRVPNNVAKLSRFTESVLHQGRMEKFFLEGIAASYPHPASPADQIKVERMVIPTSLSIDEAKVDDEDAYPLTVTVQHLTEEEATPTQQLSNLSDGLFRSNLADDDVPQMIEQSRARKDKKEEVIKAKYVVGCDGAHSWTRKTLGKDFEMHGEMTDFIWGVLDIVPITDFPDIRNRCMIHSASSGSLMIIPRENKMVRLYIQLTEVSAGGGRIDRSLITQEAIFKAAQKIISPYKLDYHYCDWWTAYQIGQRVGDKFSKLDRVFLAGDAVHTHSPKAGQGMNVSMQDTYNLGWKLGLVCKKILRREVLSTYEFERKQIAKELIAFDHKFSRLFSGRPAKDIMDETGVSMEEFSNAFNMSHMVRIVVIRAPPEMDYTNHSSQFTSGIGVNYKSSALTSKPAEHRMVKTDLEVEADQMAAHERAQSTLYLAKNCIPGMRFPSFQVIAHSGAQHWQLHHKMPSDGRFRLVVFPGDISQPSRQDLVNDLGSWLSTELLSKYPSITLSPGSDPHAGTMKFTPDRSPSVIDVLLIHTARRSDVEMLRDLHEVYHPFDSKLGWDYDKVFVDEESYHHGNGRAYEGYGVDPEEGALVVVRPDGYVGLVTSVEKKGWDEVAKWFRGVLRTV
ncbi:FAD binding domain-containing protein [Xylaria bambusicola]|uniref:FAD binding domain-containing protein n=1 Tax=Xylaria bambusicola TaxID=326684 RepID=UPI0020081FB6|nr:FAD binding domain-containing protein [Xylaria bambusicola]KAI0517065.1 FAD binding domain-containing protein [Xylaria bambusicola]